MVEMLCKTARGAADIILNAHRDMHVDCKEGHGKFVTEYDYKVQNFAAQP